MDELSAFNDVLQDKCSECGGTGRDNFSGGALWCPFCKGSGERSKQLETLKETQELQDWLKKQLNQT